MIIWLDCYFFPDRFLAGLSQKRREVADNVSSAKGSAVPLPVGQGVPITGAGIGQPVSSRTNINVGTLPLSNNVTPSQPKLPSQSAAIASDILLDNKNNTGNYCSFAFVLVLSF